MFSLKRKSKNPRPPIAKVTVKFYFSTGGTSKMFYYLDSSKISQDKVEEPLDIHHGVGVLIGRSHFVAVTSSEYVNRDFIEKISIEGWEYVNSIVYKDVPNG